MKKFQIIDLTRSFSILAVLANHSSNFLRPLSSPWAQSFFHEFQRNGSKGVFIFFVVSGFLITKIIDESSGLLTPNLREFYARRAARILPLLLLITLIGAFAMEFLPRDSQRLQFTFGSQTTLPHWWLWVSIVFFSFNWLHLLLYPLFYPGAYWGVLWTLSVEEQFYFIFPFALRKLATIQKLVFFLACILLGSLAWRALAFRFFPWTLFGRAVNPLSDFDLIALGVLLYLVFKRYWKSLASNPAACLALCGTGAALALFSYFFPEPGSVFEQVFSWPLLGLGSALFLLGGLQLPFFESRIMWFPGLPGKYCYGMYLYHYLVLFLVGSSLPALNGLAAYLALSGLTLALAAASYHWFELPANRFTRRLFGFGK